jgi:hypothetical protein
MNHCLVCLQIKMPPGMIPMSTSMLNGEQTIGLAYENVTGLQVFIILDLGKSCGNSQYDVIFLGQQNRSNLYYVSSDSKLLPGIQTKMYRKLGNEAKVYRTSFSSSVRN